VAYYYVAEIVGFNDWIIERMAAIQKFYGYTEIITKDGNYEQIKN
jgi:hypothetical protein